MQQCVVLVKRMPWLWTLSGSVKWTWRGDQMGGVIYGRTSFSSHSTHVTMVGYYDVDYAASSGERNVVAAGAHDGRPRGVWTAVHAHSVTVARCTPRLFTWCGRGAPYNKQLTCLVFDDRDQEITYITPTLERQDLIGLDVHIQHVVSSIYSMQQSTVWWTRRWRAYAFSWYVIMICAILLLCLFNFSHTWYYAYCYSVDHYTDVDTSA